MTSWGAVGAVTKVPIDAANVAATLYSKQPIDIRQGDKIELDINSQRYRVLAAVPWHMQGRRRLTGMQIVLEGMEQ